MSSDKCDAQSATKRMIQKHRVIQLLVLFAILSVPGFSIAQSNPYADEWNRYKALQHDLEKQILPAEQSGNQAEARRLAKELVLNRERQQRLDRLANELRVQDRRAEKRSRVPTSPRSDIDASAINRRTHGELRVVLPSNPGESGLVVFMPDEATRMRALTVIQITERINNPHLVRNFAPHPTELRVLKALRSKLVEHMYDTLGWAAVSEHKSPVDKLVSEHKSHVDKLRMLLNSSEVFKRYAEVLIPDTIDGYAMNPGKTWILDGQRAKPKGVAENVKGAVDRAAAEIAEGHPAKGGVKANAVNSGSKGGHGKVKGGSGRMAAVTAAAAMGLGVSASARAGELSGYQDLPVTKRLQTVVEREMSDEHLSKARVPTAGVD